MPRKPNWKICRDKNTGSMAMRIVGNWSHKADAQRLEAKYNTMPADSTFIDTIHLLGTYRYGNNSYAYKFRSVNSEAEYLMSMDGLVRMLKGTNLDHGVVSGSWGVSKVGQYQFIHLEEEL